MPVNIDDTMKALDSIVDRVMIATDLFVKEAAEEIAHKASQYAPKLSGALSNSMAVMDSSKLMVYMAKVGPTNLPYARRMELGLHRRDKRGRVYRQAGHHYFSKAEHEVLDEVGAAITDVWAEAIRG